MKSKAEVEQEDRPTTEIPVESVRVADELVDIAPNQFLCLQPTEQDLERQLDNDPELC